MTITDAINELIAHDPASCFFVKEELIYRPSDRTIVSEYSISRFKHDDIAQLDQNSNTNLETLVHWAKTLG